MKYRLIVAGKPSLSWAKAGVDDYLRRLVRYGNYELRIVKDGDSAAVSQRLLEASEGCYRIALDERGQTPTSRQFYERLEKLEMDGAVKVVALLIGASDGHTEQLRSLCDMSLSLSSMTMQHELALVMLLEQLYRLATMKAGSPYHRD